MPPRRFTPAFLLALAATAGTAGAAHAAAGHATTPPAVARSEAQLHSIDTALHDGRLTAAQADVLRAARATQEQRARELAAHPGDVAAALELSHQQDRLDWAIRSGDTRFVNTALVALR